MNDQDADIRRTAMEWLCEQTAIHGPELPWSLLLHGFRFQGERIPLVSQRGIWKPRRMELPLSIRTSWKDPYGDSYDPVRESLRYRYYGTDPNHADNWGLRRLIAEQRKLIYFHGTRRAMYHAIWPVIVVHDDPIQLTFWLQAESAAGAIGDPDIERRYATREVQQRLHQRLFRSRVLSAYGDACAMCRLRRLEFLDAAHIVGDRKPEGAPDVSNGLSLCKIHHTAFDSLLLGVDPDRVIHVRPDLLTERDGPMLRHGIQELHRQPIQLPRRKEHHPDRDKLALRYREFRAAS